MQLVILFGPPAVGKMTVGYTLAQLTGLKLFHNHMTIELVLNFFPFGHPQFRRLVGELRQRIFEEVASSELPGLIFTYVWALDQPSNKAEIDAYCALFRERGGTVYFVELAAEQTERIKRNKSEFRLAQKTSKRNIVGSERNLLNADQDYKLNSTNDFFYQTNYIRIDNTNLSPLETAQQIIQFFNFRTVEGLAPEI